MLPRLDKIVMVLEIQYAGVMVGWLIKLYHFCNFTFLNFCEAIMMRSKFPNPLGQHAPRIANNSLEKTYPIAILCVFIQKKLRDTILTA